ncbi:MAG TPA: hypothetical protein ENI23_16970 [bacterium]|nr:hypothetical protein [bacterium]
MPQNELQTLRDVFTNHQHRGGDGSQQLALLDWKLLIRRQLPVASASIVLENVPSRQFLKIFIFHGAKASNGNTLLRFNNDTSGNYSSISRENDTARASATSIDLMDTLNDTTKFFFVVDVVNIADSEKSVVSEGVQILTSAAGTQLIRQVYGTWVNTTAQINRVDIVSSGGNFPADSRVAIYGTNF